MEYSNISLSLIEDLKNIFEDIEIIIKEHSKKPHYLFLIKGNDKLKFRIVEYKPSKIKNKYKCELFINGLNTELGELFGSILNKFIQFRDNNEVLNVSVSNDFIFLRVYRYIFKNEKSVDFMDIGPHLTLRLIRIQSDDFKKDLSYKKKISQNL